MSTELVESRSSYTVSMLLHLSVVLFAAFGLPRILPKTPDPEPLVMTVEIMPITGVTNVKPSDKPITEEKNSKAPEIKKPVPPTMKEPPKPVEKPVEKPIEKAAAPPKPAEPKEAEPLPDSKPKDIKPVEKPKDQPKPKPDEFAALLNKLQQEAKTEKSKPAKDATTSTENKTKSDAPYDPGLPLSLSEKDAIRGQFIPCWQMPIGAKDPKSLAARVHILLQPDGTVISAELVNDQLNRYSADPFFRAAADKALRAVHNCSPLKNLPPDKYNTWKDIELNFNPADLL